MCAYIYSSLHTGPPPSVRMHASKCSCSSDKNCVLDSTHHNDAGYSIRPLQARSNCLVYVKPCLSIIETTSRGGGARCLGITEIQQYNTHNPQAACIVELSWVHVPYVYTTYIQYTHTRRRKLNLDGSDSSTESSATHSSVRPQLNSEHIRRTLVRNERNIVRFPAQSRQPRLRPTDTPTAELHGVVRGLS